MGLMLLAISTSLAGPVPMFGRAPPSGVAPIYVVFVVPNPPPDPSRAIPGREATRWDVPEGPRPTEPPAGPSFWQVKPTAVEQPGKFVPVEALGAAFEPLPAAKNALAE